MVEVKEGYFEKRDRLVKAQLAKIQEILSDYICEDGGFCMSNYIYLYKSKNIFLIFGSVKEYIGKIYYDSPNPSELNMKGKMDLIKPIAVKLEEHGFKVTIYH